MTSSIFLCSSLQFLSNWLQSCSTSSTFLSQSSIIRFKASSLVFLLSISNYRYLISSFFSYTSLTRLKRPLQKSFCSLSSQNFLVYSKLMSVFSMSNRLFLSYSLSFLNSFRQFSQVSSNLFLFCNYQLQQRVLYQLSLSEFNSLVSCLMALSFSYRLRYSSSILAFCLMMSRRRLFSIAYSCTLYFYREQMDFLRWLPSPPGLRQDGRKVDSLKVSQGITLCESLFCLKMWDPLVRSFSLLSRRTEVAPERVRMRLFSLLNLILRTLPTFTWHLAQGSTQLYSPKLTACPCDAVRSLASIRNNPATILLPFSVVRLTVSSNAPRSAVSLRESSWLKTNWESWLAVISSVSFSPSARRCILQGNLAERVMVWRVRVHS